VLTLASSTPERGVVQPVLTLASSTLSVPMRDDQPVSEAAAQAGLAHVATASFLASRVVPTGGYAVALAGGVALARAAQVAGMRTGYGASLAAMLQAIAVLGPSRVSVPLTQALSAPLLGRLHVRESRLATQIGVCAAIRAIDQAVLTLFYIWIITGGVDAYAATYDAIAGRIPGVPDGPVAALAATALVLVAWTVFASVVQVLVYRAALRGWPAGAGADAGATLGGWPSRAGADVGAPLAGGRALAAVAGADDDLPAPRPRYDPRAVALASVVAFCVLVATTAWLVLGAVAAWLAIAWATARADRSPLRAGLALAALLAFGALVFGLIGGAGLNLTLQRTVRAGLLVLVATWLRAAAGEDGMREVARRSLRFARRVPAMGEASEILDRLGAGGALGASGRALVAEVRHVPRAPSALAAAVLRWVATEAARFRASLPAPASASDRLRAAWRDRVLVAAVIAAVAGAVVAG
jgi:hypothetical protein